MNRVAGLINATGSEDERAHRLQQAIGLPHPELTIIHPQPTVSLAWSGDIELGSLAKTDRHLVFAYGYAYQTNLHCTSQVSIDSINSLTRLMLERTGNSRLELNDLAGSFIILTGTKDNDFMLAGDPSGNRSPFISLNTTELVFSNHPLVCARLQGAVLLDRSMEDFFLIYGFYPDNRTTYKHVQQLPTGVSLEFKQDCWRHKPLKAQEDNTPSLPEKRPWPDKDLHNQLYKVMLHCIKDQLPSTSEVAVLLGGFDSALVASLLHRLGKNVHTYSFRYSDSQYNQPHTDTLSRKIGCKHTWVDITPEVIAAGIESYAETYTQPTNWLNYVIQTAFLSNKIRADGIKYAYTGDGCDTLFLGYPGTYKRTHIFSQLPHLPSGLVNALVSTISSSFLDCHIGHPYRITMGLLRAMARPMPSRAFLTFRVMDETTIKTLRRGKEPGQDEALEATLRRLAEPFNNLSIQRLGYAAKSMVSPNKIKLLAITDTTGIRVNSPYLHPVLRNFTAAIPDHLLREEGQHRIGDPGKLCLARMAEKYSLLPHEVIYQPKLAAIDSPIDEWFSTSLRSSVKWALSGLPFEPDIKQINSLINNTWAEVFYKRHIGSTRVISDAISLLTTYGAFGATAKEAG